MTPLEKELFDQANRICASEAFRETLLRHLPAPLGGDASQRLDARIHENDQMLLHSLRHHGDAHVALSQYHNVALQQYNAMRQILHQFHPPPHDRLRFLDFACGYGRLIRLLTLFMPAGNVTASEIQPEAVRFVEDRFGVRGLLSHLDPTQFRPVETFGFIWVASLFSHLPEDLFHAWLARLWALVDQTGGGGALCFSVHDAALLPEGVSLPEAGILYGEHSEIAELATTHYGTTYVSETFVRQAVRQAAGAEATCFRIGKGLAHEQDIYVVTRRRDTSGLAGFRRGPWGWVDERRTGPSGELYLRGWAASLDDGPLANVSITVNGRAHTCPTGLIRTDVARVLADPRLATSGWEFRCPLPSSNRVRVEVTAESRTGERALLYVGSPPSAAPEGARPSPGYLHRFRNAVARLVDPIRKP